MFFVSFETFDGDMAIVCHDTYPEALKHIVCAAELSDYGKYVWVENERLQTNLVLTGVAVEIYSSVHEFLTSHRHMDPEVFAILLRRLSFAIEAKLSA